MTLDEVYKYFNSHKEDFFKKLDECININSISKSNKTCPMTKLYMEVRKNTINEQIKPTKGRLNIQEVQK